MKKRPLQSNILFEWRNAIMTSNLPPTTRLVLMVISTHMNLNGGRAFPSQKTIANEAGISREWAGHLIRQAETAGWLGRDLYPNPSGKGWRRTHYTIQIPIIVEKSTSLPMNIVEKSISPPNEHRGEVERPSWRSPLLTNSSMNSPTGKNNSSTGLITHQQEDKMDEITLDDNKWLPLLANGGRNTSTADTSSQIVTSEFDTTLKRKSIAFIEMPKTIDNPIVIERLRRSGHWKGDEPNPTLKSQPPLPSPSVRETLCDPSIPCDHERCNRTYNY
jgi:Helix-turn-helix domain